MKILIYYEQYGYGGVDTHLGHLINHWPQEDDQFIVVSNPDNTGLSFLKQMLRNPSVKFHTLDRVFFKVEEGASKFSLFFIYLKIQLRFVEAFKELLVDESPDILLSNNGGYPGGITNWLAAIIGKKNKFTEKSTFLLVHHAPTSEVKGPISLFSSLMVRLIRYFDVPFVTVSKASKTMLEKYTPIKNMHIIYNGLDLSERVSNPYDFKSRLSIDQEKIIIGIIGPIDLHKGHSNMFEVFKRSSTLLEKAHFVIVGSGKKQVVTKLQTIVREYGLNNIVTFSGFLPGNSIDIISGFDLMVMPTIDFEGFGYSMAEAMVAEVPVVASRVGSIPEIIVDGESGFLIDPTDFLGWQLILEKLLQSSNLRHQIGCAGRQRIINNFSANKMSQNYHKLLTNEYI
jgi:glycosyltransferase involved in cell wall biosynthesis